jgi:hypothetical protein
LEIQLKNFKLGILIPLKARKVSQDWSIVEMALKRVLLSISNQTSSKFICVVVGHDEPSSYSVSDLSKNTTFVKFNELEPPNKDKYSDMELQLKYEVDRCSKITKGTMVLQKHGITHWFALDADDLIHSSFVERIGTLVDEDTDAIVIDNGYFYSESRRVINKANNFTVACGSSCIIKAELTKIPDILDINAYRKTFYGSVSHMDVKEYFFSHDLKYIIPEELLVMYVRDHGDNISNYYFRDWLSKLKKYILLYAHAVPFTNEQYESFGFKSEK